LRNFFRPPLLMGCQQLYIQFQMLILENPKAQGVLVREK
jgi:hypothetical protein